MDIKGQKVQVKYLNESNFLVLLEYDCAKRPWIDFNIDFKRLLECLIDKTEFWLIQSALQVDSILIRTSGTFFCVSDDPYRHVTVIVIISNVLRTPSVQTPTDSFQPATTKNYIRAILELILISMDVASSIFFDIYSHIRPCSHLCFRPWLSSFLFTILRVRQNGRLPYKTVCKLYE